jgi:hypothetical protein
VAAWAEWRLGGERGIPAPALNLFRLAVFLGVTLIFLVQGLRSRLPVI